VLREAYRVLEPGGLLVWQGPFDADARTAAALGFEVLRSATPREEIYRKPAGLSRGRAPAVMQRPQGSVAPGVSGARESLLQVLSQQAAHRRR
jgi:hypothetical protein